MLTVDLYLGEYVLSLGEDHPLYMSVTDTINNSVDPAGNVAVTQEGQVVTVAGAYAAISGVSVSVLLSNVSYSADYHVTGTMATVEIGSLFTLSWKRFDPPYLEWSEIQTPEGFWEEVPVPLPDIWTPIK